jgi:hypothetical protein
VEVQAQRLKEINPDLAVVPIASAVEKIPLGRLRADVLLTGLDSRRSRLHVNGIAWRLGLPWIDAGVEAGNRLVRINTYFPAEDSPCMECMFTQADYEAVEQEYPCGDATGDGFSTGGASSLGALAAALQAVELEDLLNGRLERSNLGREIVLSAECHRIFVTGYQRNPECRFDDHGVWSIERLTRGPRELTVGDALQLGSDGAGEHASGLRVVGSRFVRRLTCRSCGITKPLLYLEASLRIETLNCPSCGEAETMTASGFDKVESLIPSAMPDLSLGRPLACLGLRAGDVISVGGPDNENHLEIGGSDA